MGFGLRTQQSSQQYLRERHSEAAVLSRSYLNALSLRHAIPPWPSPGIQELAFPCIILEAKSDSQPLLYAENQAAGETATCLKMIERLEEVYFNTNGQRFSPLSVLAICSEGPTFETLIAFQSDISDASIAQNIHLVTIWKGDITDYWNLFLLLLLSKRASSWVEERFRPSVVAMLEGLRKVV
ncbi:hypothetical protein FA10DRAFT_270040 [Acaromyces ingoldii]|uniref:Uncharacterized protein n=1 Tax=Acaromyces ingoldii TaxID=215250 RepID=A0A316YDC7_9BASI|nr:hypothetical protein FA10DRAFT_270040 [Acaromyces ingoldii]PWN86668.1 hypothetical protein FA10DRAFT_270040 [Acaromyces ingoldii]